MAEMNELLEEAASKAKDLSDEASDWLEALQKMLDRANDVSQRFGDEGREASGHLKALASHLEEATGKLESAASDAGSDLDGLVQKAEALKADIGQVLERVKKDLDDLDEQKDRIHDSIDSQFHSTASEMRELGQQIQEREAATGTHLTEAQKSIDEFRTFVETARGELGQKQADWGQALSELWVEVIHRTEAWTNALGSALNRQTTAMGEMANHMIEKHNEAMEQLKQKFAEDAKAEVLTSLDPLRTALEDLQQMCQDREADFEGRSGEILDKIRTIVPVIDEISVALQTADEMMNL